MRVDIVRRNLLNLSWLIFSNDCSDCKVGCSRRGEVKARAVLAIVCIIFGVLVIVFPALLEWIVGLFLIIQGILLLTDYLELRTK